RRGSLVRPLRGAAGAGRLPRQGRAGEPAAAAAEQLTERENAVLALMARASTNQEIAAALFVSEATVKSHVGSIFAKLGVRDRAAAIVFAFDHGVVDAGQDP